MIVAAQDIRLLERAFHDAIAAKGKVTLVIVGHLRCPHTEITYKRALQLLPDDRLLFVDIADATPEAIHILGVTGIDVSAGIPFILTLGDGRMVLDGSGSKTAEQIRQTIAEHAAELVVDDGDDNDED